MSTIKVTNLSGRGGASPNLPDGANVTGVLTATSFVGSGANLTGLANTDFINAEQVTVVGVVTTGALRISTGGTVGPAGSGIVTYYGDGSGLTGVGETIAPHNYNPDVYDTAVSLSELTSSGIGITFNKKVEAGSGTATLKIVNAGAAGTTIQSWGVSSCTFDVTKFNLDANVSNLVLNQTYQVDIPDGFIVDSNETSYVGTAWTFTATGPVGRLFSWGQDTNGSGSLGLNKSSPGLKYSSPVQVGGVSWRHVADLGNGSGAAFYGRTATKTDGSLWAWGINTQGEMGIGNVSPGYYSSPVQIPGSTWVCTSSTYLSRIASKSDGTLWSWGRNGNGQLGLNQGGPTLISSPTQIPGTTWTGTKETMSGGRYVFGGIKTDGTLWMWGDNSAGELGVNDVVVRSSPIQIPGTTWSKISVSTNQNVALKTNGTLWAWGKNNVGQLGQNNKVDYSSPVQIPGTDWAFVQSGNYAASAIKTDGTLYTWGYNQNGKLGQNSGANAHRSSPVQVPGTTWSKISMGEKACVASKTDGTLWSWGGGENGALGVPSIGEGSRSSPVQIPGTEWTGDVEMSGKSVFVILEDTTP